MPPNKVMKKKDYDVRFAFNSAMTITATGCSSKAEAIEKAKKYVKAELQAVNVDVDDCDIDIS